MDKEKLHGLYVVATPIGNLGDITYRAIEILNNVDYIVSENPTTTLKLLNHYKLQKRVLSYREENHDRVLPQLLQDLKNDISVALVSEAGTPVVSDPGIKLVKECHAHGVQVTPIPGASAVTAAVSSLPVPGPRFMFYGFAPRKKGEFTRLIIDNKELLVKEKMSVVVFESPHRIKKTLELLQEFAAELEKENILLTVGLGKEITKIYEKMVSGTPTELLTMQVEKKFYEKGEFTVVISLLKQK